jgi:hypothetical protein
MAEQKLEERVTELERQLAELRRRIDLLSRPNDWRSVVGMFTGDEVMKRIDESVRRNREKDRERARKATGDKPTKGKK